MAYFERIDSKRFLATAHTGGAWNTQEQHIAPAIGLLTHVVEQECLRLARGFQIGRLSFDILGPIPIGALRTELHSLRSGRTIELLEAVASYGDRPALRLRAWLMAPTDCRALQGSPFPALIPRESMPAWDASSLWPGAFIKTVDVQRVLHSPGHASYWVRAQHALLEHEPVGPLARAATLFDVANGMSVRAHPQEVAFPNLDLTAHLFATPQPEWLGFETRVSFGANGLGLSSSVIYDDHGPIGTVAQTLTVRP